MVKYPRAILLRTGQLSVVQQVHYTMGLGVYRVTYIEPVTLRQRGCVAVCEDTQFRETTYDEMRAKVGPAWRREG